MQIGIHCMPFTNLKHSSLFNNFINYSNSYFNHIMLWWVHVKWETKQKRKTAKRHTTKRNTTKRNEIRRNETNYVNWETKRNRICKLRNETKQNEIIQWILEEEQIIPRRPRPFQLYVRVYLRNFTL
jgi:hypothetical protein